MLFKCAEMATGKTAVARIAPLLQCQAKDMASPVF
jgi:hypothetical protein